MFYVRETEKEEEAVEKLLKDTPLSYSWVKTKDIALVSQKSTKAQDEY